MAEQLTAPESDEDLIKLLNEASRDELIALRFVGEAIADEIIAARKEQRFTSIEELKERLTTRAFNAIRKAQDKSTETDNTIPSVGTAEKKLFKAPVTSGLTLPRGLTAESTDFDKKTFLAALQKRGDVQFKQDDVPPPTLLGVLYEPPDDKTNVYVVWVTEGRIDPDTEFSPQFLENLRKIGTQPLALNQHFREWFVDRETISKILIDGLTSAQAENDLPVGFLAAIKVQRSITILPPDDDSKSTSAKVIKVLMDTLAARS